MQHAVAHHRPSEIDRPADAVDLHAAAQTTDRGDNVSRSGQTEQPLTDAERKLAAVPDGTTTGPHQALVVNQLARVLTDLRGPAVTDAIHTGARAADGRAVSGRRRVLDRLGDAALAHAASC